LLLPGTEGTAVLPSTTGTVPQTFADVITCIRAGYSIEVGGSVRAALQKNGEWSVGGTWGHAFNWCFYKPGFIGMTNSHGDGFGWLPLVGGERMYKGRFSCFVVLDIERGRKGKANY
jgi:hypothetical protein